jgi:uncharacterized protein with HEPN domain
MQKKYNIYLNDILNSIDKIKRYIKDLTYEEFIKDEKTIDAITRNLEIIGEAVNNIPIEVKNKYPNIPWRTIKDMRNTIVHQYWKIDLEIEWEIINTKIDILKQQILEIKTEQ